MYAEAESLYKRALHIREQQLGPEHPNVAFVLLITASPVLDYDDWVEQDHWAGRLWLASLGKWQPYGGEMVALGESMPLTLETILKTSGGEKVML